MYLCCLAPTKCHGPAFPHIFCVNPVMFCKNSLQHSQKKILLDQAVVCTQRKIKHSSKAWLLSSALCSQYVYELLKWVKCTRLCRLKLDKAGFHVGLQEGGEEAAGWKLCCQGGEQWERTRAAHKVRSTTKGIVCLWGCLAVLVFSFLQAALRQQRVSTQQSKWKAFLWCLHL